MDCGDGRGDGTTPAYGERMSRSMTLARTLSLLLAAALPASGCNLDCEDRVDEDVVVMATDTERFASVIDDCLEKKTDCQALCLAVYQEMYGEYSEYDACKAFFPNRDEIELRYVTIRRDCDDGSVDGRRPPGLVGAVSRATSDIGHKLAAMARLEEASIPAFLWLATELEHHGAPMDLVRRARQAAVDEVLHTRLAWAMAARYGAVAPRAVVDLPVAPRSLEDIAVENMVEGCVRETYGALIALYQSQHAQDSQVRGFMKRIAEEEAEHAQLGADIDSWVRAIRPRLVPALEAARVRGIEELRVGIENEESVEVRTQLGLPSSSDHRTLFAALEDSIWKADEPRQEDVGGAIAARRAVGDGGRGG